MASKSGFFIGVDVGTQSVRAGLVTPYGTVVDTASQPIKTWNPEENIYEQSSDDIWNSVIKVVKVCLVKLHFFFFFFNFLCYSNCKKCTIASCYDYADCL